MSTTAALGSAAIGGEADLLAGAGGVALSAAAATDALAGSCARDDGGSALLALAPTVALPVALAVAAVVAVGAAPAAGSSAVVTQLRTSMKLPMANSSAALKPSALGMPRSSGMAEWLAEPDRVWGVTALLSGSLTLAVRSARRAV